MILTSIWKKSKKFRGCNPTERYLFLYLLTNDELEMCGAYEHELMDIVHFTGLDEPQVKLAFDGLKDWGLVTYKDGWVVIHNYMKNQNMGNIKVRTGVENSLASLPDDIRSLIDESSSDIDTLSRPSCDSDSDIDIDIDRRVAETSRDNHVTKPPPPLKNKFQAGIDDWFYSRYPYTSFGKERKAVASLAAKSRRQAKETGVGSSSEVIHAMLDAYEELISGDDKFWTKQPLTPSSLLSLWDRVIAEMRSRAPKKSSAAVKEFFGES